VGMPVCTALRCSLFILRCGLSRSRFYLYRSQNEADLEIRGKNIEYNKNNTLYDSHFLSQNDYLIKTIF
jgi:hypothetical protein